MTPAPIRHNNRDMLAWVWLILVLIGSVVVGVVWYLSPPALGMSGRAPTEMLGFLLWLSWWVGLPVLAIAQITALVMAIWHPVGAAGMASVTLALFLLAIGRIAAAW